MPLSPTGRKRRTKTTEEGDDEMGVHAGLHESTSLSAVLFFAPFPFLLKY